MSDLQDYFSFSVVYQNSATRRVLPKLARVQELMNRKYYVAVSLIGVPWVHSRSFLACKHLIHKQVAIFWTMQDRSLKVILSHFSFCEIMAYRIQHQLTYAQIKICSLCDIECLFKVKRENEEISVKCVKTWRYVCSVILGSVWWLWTACRPTIAWFFCDSWALY